MTCNGAPVDPRAREMSCPVLNMPGKVKKIRTRSTDSVVLAILRERFPDAEIEQVA